MIDAKLTPWIPVEAALPSDGQLVLVAWPQFANGHLGIDLVNYRSEDGGNWDAGEYSVKDPVWWMPVPDLPTLPKKDA